MARAAGDMVGIDFGTSTSFVIGPSREILSLGERRYLPSVVAVVGRRLLVGEAAANESPDRVIRSAKRAITDRQTHLAVGGRYATAHRPREQVITAIFKELGDRARNSGLPLKPNDTLRLGCPAEWTNDQRNLLLVLAKSGGLPTAHAEIFEEPVAAGVAWLEQPTIRHRGVQGRLLVFDMGGGTLDIAVMRVVGGSAPEITVLTSVGSGTAGDVLDELIFNDIVTHYQLDVASMREPMQATHHLLNAAIDTKTRLSADATHDILLNARLLGVRKLPSLRYARDRLNDVFAPMMDEAETTLLRALRLARFTDRGGSDIAELLKLTSDELAADIDFVLPVGGMSRVPYVTERLKAFFPRAELIFNFESADQAVVQGLASTAKLNTINMYRPGFDFELVCPRERIRLYTRFTPLFTDEELMLGQTKLAYRFDIPTDRLPRSGNGHLEVYAANGGRVNLTHHLKAAFASNDRKTDAFPVRFGHYAIRFALYTDGRIHITDGHGDDHELRVEGWPVIVRPGMPPPPRQSADPPVYYPYNKS